MFKAIVKNMLGHLVNRERLNDSKLYQAYIRIFFPKVESERRAEAYFYRNALDRSKVDLIFDIGANGGNKTIVFLKYSNSVVAVEPNPDMVRILEQRYSHNPRVRIVEKACGAASSIAEMQTFDEANAFGTLSRKWADELVGPAELDDRGPIKAGKTIKVSVTTLDELIKIYGLPHYIKIDTEGFELEVIKGLTSVVPLVSFECNLPIFRKETLDVIYQLSTRDRNAAFNFVVTEPPKHFQSSRWLSAEEMANIVEADTFRFMEIFCRSSHDVTGAT